ncbi:hypothetical protein COB72_10920 [bacterium]|nr:MAG: hypothetical protein COB72_10920 [bacterium]
MVVLHTIFLQISNYENIGFKSILIATILALLGVVRYLYISKEKALKDKSKRVVEILKEKDDKIMAVISAHQNDLKESNSDMKEVVEKYHLFTQHLKDAVNARLPK